GAVRARGGARPARAHAVRRARAVRVPAAARRGRRQLVGAELRCPPPHVPRLSGAARAAGSDREVQRAVPERRRATSRREAATHRRRARLGRGVRGARPTPRSGALLMKRRTFLELIGSGTAALALRRPLYAAAAASAGEHFFIFVHASGGWDVTLW